MSLTFDPQTEQRIQRELARGHYTDAAQVIHRALDLLDAQEDWLLRNQDAIHERIEESVAAAERGELYTAEEAARLLDQRIAEKAARRAS